MSVRVIPRLDIKGPNLVKGVHMEGLRVLGKPEQFARHYYESGADELLYMDVVASLYGRNSLLDLIERTAREVFIPLTVGGGIRSVADIRRVLRAGADKVAINTEAVRRPEFICEAAHVFGSSTIVVSIEAIRQSDGRYLAYTDCGREWTGLDAVDWAVKAAELGAGELLVSSVDRDGTGKGFDVELTRQIARLVSVPVIASGGAGQLEHVCEVVDRGSADAVGLASLLHYDFVRSGAPSGHATTPKTQEGNLEFVRRQTAWSAIRSVPLAEVKQCLWNSGVDCRLN
ncbi:MAG: imidazole glycerol phosphate synthase subunit HisF [Planctomycetes bacterium]|nr:imidazole glycerol phosphate synthase subunit HisF [Planctomycetota bacterium]